jgi:acetyl-CoA synthetase
MLNAMASNTERYRAARDQVLAMVDDDRLAATFSWPHLVGAFNWATDWFDVIARGNDRTALRIVEEDGSEQSVSFAAMADRSDRVAAWLEQLVIGKGDRVVLMLGNQVELWDRATLPTASSAVERGP